MASGSFTGVTSNSLTQVRIDWSSQSNVEANTSAVTATMYLYKSSSYSLRTYGTGNWTINIDGNSITVAGTVSLYHDAGWVPVASHSTTIHHAADGTKSISISASGGISGTTLSSISCSRTVALDTIPRASTLSFSASAVDAGNAINFTLQRASTAFTHKAIFSLSSYSQTVSLEDALQGSFTPPLTWCSAIPSATSATVSCVLETYSGGTKIGTKQYAFTMYVPQSIIPTLQDVTCSVISGAWGLYVQGQSRCALSFVNAAGAYASTIKTFVVSSLFASSVSPITSGILSAAGNVSFQCYVQDSRGRNSAVITKTITVHPYSKPTLQATAYRCDAQGTPSNDGTHLLVQANYACSSLDGNNTATCHVTYSLAGSQSQSAATMLKSGTAAVIGSGSIDAAGSYDVNFTVTDGLSAQATYCAQVAPSFRLINTNASHNGVAVGRMSSKHALQCALDAEFDGSISVAGQVDTASLSLKETQIYVGGDLNTYYPVHIRTDTYAAMPTFLFLSKALGTIYPSWAYNHPTAGSSIKMGWMYRSNGWDGNGIYCKPLYKDEPYAPLISNLSILTDNAATGIVLWLRGGGADYQLACNVPFYANVHLSAANLSEVSGSSKMVEPTMGMGNRGNYRKNAFDSPNEAIWGEQEYINPPMVLGVEYRTTERFNGKVVYAQALDFGYMPNISYKTALINYGITGLIRVEGYCNYGNNASIAPFATVSFVQDVSIDSGVNLRITTIQDASKWYGYPVVYYTKD